MELERRFAVVDREFRVVSNRWDVERGSEERECVVMSMAYWTAAETTGWYAKSKWRD